MRAGCLIDSIAKSALLSGRVLANAPAMRREKFLANRDGLVFERRSERVVPAVQEPKHRDNTNDLHDLLFAPVRAQFREHGVSCGIRHRTAGYGKIKRGPLRGAEQRAGLIVPDSGELCL